MLNNVKAGFCFLLFLIHFIFFRFKLLNFDFKSSRSPFHVITVCLVCVFCTKERLNCTRNKMVLGKPPETDSARLGHIPSLPWKLQLPLKPYFSLHPPDFKGNCNFVRFSLRFLLHFIVQFLFAPQMWAARPHLDSIFEKLLHRKTFYLPAVYN